jgi:Raf kinase inhibitor-like YbhB/YbcL family protein
MLGRMRIGGDAMAMTLTSPSFGEGGTIPERHTCDDRDVSPALSWQGAPAGTVAFALVMDDPDARGWVHWVVYDIPGGTLGSLSEGVRPKDLPPQGMTSFGRTGWGGPCPPSGTHHYVLTLYALSGPIGLSGAPCAAQVRAAAAPLTLDTATLTGTYKRR